MTTLYVGPGGNDANNGLSWANRRLTLNGVEDKPVAAGDTVYVGPGVYRETLTVDVAGSSGNPITYIGDVPLNATDTNTLGTLRVAVFETGALPVWQDFMVVPANVWDSMFGSSALNVNVSTISSAAVDSILDDPVEGSYTM